MANLTTADITRLNALADHYEEIIRPYPDSTYTTPLNRDAEKVRVFEAHKGGREYNPVFEYTPYEGSISRQLVTVLSGLDPARSDWDRLLLLDVQGTLQHYEMLNAHDSGHITGGSMAAYGYLSDDLVQTAYRILNEQQRPEAQKNSINAEAAFNTINTALAKAGCDGWTAELTNSMHSRLMVRTTQQKVMVRHDSTFTPEAIRRLLIHEVGTHVFRYINGSRQPLSLMRMGLHRYLATEEGMAAYNQHIHNLLDPGAMRRYALHVVAIYYAMTHSFFETFTHLMQFTTKTSAFNYAVRAKRGFTNTADYGSHVKDKIYLEGFLMVQAYAEQHPQDYALLMSGKVSVGMLPLVRELQSDGLWEPPQFLPEMLL